MSFKCLKQKLLGGPVLPELYTKPPSRSYKLVETHHIYVKDPSDVTESLPPPRPPVRQKSEMFDITKFDVVDEKAIRVPMTILAKPIEALVVYLTDGLDDQLSKVRVLYRWLTNQPIQRMQVLDSRPSNKTSALRHLWLLRNNKQRYSNFFSLLCRYAHVHCVVTHGVVKGSHYEVGEKIDSEKHYGEWNAVCIDAEWRFVDALWGGCDVRDPGDGRGHFHYDERFFLIDPKDLIYTHLAGCLEWQLLDVPRKEDVFQDTVCVKSRFFDFGMQVMSHPGCEIMAQDGDVEILFGVKPRMISVQKFSCYISQFDKPDSKQRLTKGNDATVPIFQHKPTESSVSFRIRFPKCGVFRVEIVGKEVSKDSLYKIYDWIAVYKVTVNENAQRGFPKMDSIGWGPGEDIGKIGLSPFNYTSGIIVARNTLTKLRFKIMDSSLVQNMKFFFKIASTRGNDQMINTVSDRFEIDLNIITFFIEAPPVGEYTLKMFARNVRGHVDVSDKREVNICNYLLISDLQQQSSPLAMLKERTEIADDQGQFQTARNASSPDRLPKRPMSDVSIDRPSKVSESIVSTSGVVVDFKTPVKAKSPVAVDQDKDKTTNSTSEEPVAKRIPETKVTMHAGTGGRLDEKPEMHAFVVKPVIVKPDTEKREMKVASINRIVPLQDVGRNGESKLLVSADHKLTRPASGIRRHVSESSNTRYFTTTAHVKDGRK